ncbi:MAG: DUF4032 domain-containing protein [Candidatus Omnitrophica bacterium]|nr:DUF4032 domain-containing protein [Candidatus Omnitrophota bacterium]
MGDYKFDQEKLLSDKRVIAEIERHLWLESEKAGHDVGFDEAKEDWLNRFAMEWIKYHMPNEYAQSKKSSVNKISKKKGSLP